MGRSEHAVAGVVTACLQASGAPWREVASGEWGLALADVGGQPLEVGLRVADGLLRVQAWAAPPGVLDPHLLLHRNRLGVLARYAHASAGDVHVHAEVFLEGLTNATLDRVLGAVVEAADVARAGGGAGPVASSADADGAAGAARDH